MIRHDHISVNFVLVFLSLVVKPFVDEIQIFLFCEDVFPLADGEGDKIGAIGFEGAFCLGLS